ncbi:TetR family transcriptional regulator [Nocardia cyriacigeorgica]|nr:TetR family transcriptional regulator [Nocardia cyriacigeorgica]
MDSVEQKHSVGQNTPASPHPPGQGAEPTRRERVLDAAIDLLGARGPRALTHRAVDEAAAVPVGTTSNYFRTREALLTGITERLEQRDYADWSALTTAPLPDTVEQLAAGMARFVGHAVTADRTRTLARYALFLEAQSAPAVLASLQRGHSRLSAWAGAMLRAVGAGEWTTTPMVDYLEGLIMHRLISDEAASDPAPQLHLMLRALLSASDDSSG